MAARDLNPASRAVIRFLSRFLLVVQHVAERCHVAKSLFHISTLIAIVFPSMLDSLTVVDSVMVSFDLSST